MDAGLLFSSLLLQTLVIPVYTHDISPNYREAVPRYHTEMAERKKAPGSKFLIRHR